MVSTQLVRRFPILLLLALASLNGLGQVSDNTIDWNNPVFSYAKIYLYGLEKYAMDLIVENDSLNKTVYDTNGTLLNEEQAQRAIDIILGKKGSSNDEQVFCFIPHHGIVFYNTQDEIVGHISVCVYCRKIYAAPNVPFIDKGIDEMKSLILELNQPVFNDPMEYEEYARQQRR